MDAGSERDVPGQYASSLHDVLPADDADPFLVASGSLDRKQALNEIKRLLEPRLRRTTAPSVSSCLCISSTKRRVEALPLPEALDLLREIGYENLRAKLNRQKAIDFAGTLVMERRIQRRRSVDGDDTGAIPQTGATWSRPGFRPLCVGPTRGPPDFATGSDTPEGLFPPQRFRMAT